MDDTVLSNPPEARCRACEAPLQPGSTTCGRCGAVFGEADRCPHCRVIAGTDVRAGIGHCRVCGGPRIALSEAGVLRSGNENQWLESARSLSLGITAARLGGYAALGSSALGALFALMLGVALHSFAAPLTIALLSTLIFTLGIALQRRARRAQNQQQAALEKARQLVAADILAQRPALESAELGRMLGLNPEQAELLMAELNVEQLLAPGPSAGSTQRLPEEEAFQGDPGVPATELAPNLDVTQAAPALARLDRRS